MVSFLLALLAMLDLADDGLDWNDVEAGVTQPREAHSKVPIRPAVRANNPTE
jgi:hypothetical protein